MLSKERVLGGLWGAVIGDALGVPVEFVDRATLKGNPVTGMREYGSHHQPKGTWSDDSSLLLCTVESLIHGFDLDDLARRFIRWRHQGHWTPWGSVFDIGMATSRAISKLASGVPAEEAGADDENSNGNGSLMRMLPIGIYCAEAPTAQILESAHRASCLTHRHPRSRMACGLYCLIVTRLLEGKSPAEACQRASQEAPEHYKQAPYSNELPHFQDLLSGRIAHLPRQRIRASGYVVDTLIAGLWCLLNSGSYQETVLKAVNLGEDTDTVGTVAGGLAGLHFGLEDVPVQWLSQLARRNDIAELFERFVAALHSQSPRPEGDRHDR